MTAPEVMTAHRWTPHDGPFEKCLGCGLVQGVLYSGHWTDLCPGRRPCMSCQRPLGRGDLAFCATCKSDGTAEAFRERQS